MNDTANLVIGQGINQIKFLMTVSEVVALLGKPDDEQKETIEGEKTITLSYDLIETDFVFSETEDGDFALSSMLCTSENLVLDSKIRYGDTKETFLKYVKSLKADDPQIEKDDSSGEEFFYYDDLGLLAVFTSDKLSGIQLEYWEDGGEE